MAHAIETSGLIKTFGDTRALAGVDLTIREGMVYGLLGPNGAGKTTLIRILATLLRPTEGTAKVLGHDVVRDAKSVREKVSLTGQYASVDEDLTGHENLRLVGRLLGMSWREARARADLLLDAFGLTDAAGRQVRTYSGGMRRRVDIAASLVAVPEVLFLDEPTTGLDPRSRNQVWDLVRRIAAEGTTVLLTTQYLEEADRLAERMAVIEHGRVIAEGTSRDLKASIGSNSLRLRIANVEARPRALEIITRVLGAGALSTPETAGNGNGAATRGSASTGDGGAKNGHGEVSEPLELAARVQSSIDAAKVLAALGEAGVEVAQFAVGDPSLDEVFLALTGKSGDESAAPSTAANPVKPPRPEVSR